MINTIKLSQHLIENQIFHIRGLQVMIDSSLAKLYGVPTSRLNEQVKRNIERFPDDFMFQLTETEWKNLISQNAITSWGGRRKLPFAFTEQGVAGLSAVLKSKAATNMHVAIMRAFVALRKYIQNNQFIDQRLEKVEIKLLKFDQQFDQVFKALENRLTIPSQGIFFEGQVFDAYELVARIIKSAKKSIVLIDNYVDESTIIHLAKKKKGVEVLLLCEKVTKTLELDVTKANKQYGGFKVRPFSKSHDRFLIIDEQGVYHLGASLKDLGKKWFAFSKMDSRSVKSMMRSITDVFSNGQ